MKQPIKSLVLFAIAALLGFGIWQVIEMPKKMNVMNMLQNYERPDAPPLPEREDTVTIIDGEWGQITTQPEETLPAADSLTVRQLTTEQQMMEKTKEILDNITILFSVIIFIEIFNVFFAIYLARKIIQHDDR